MDPAPCTALILLCTNPAPGSAPILLHTDPCTTPILLCTDPAPGSAPTLLRTNPALLSHPQASVTGKPARAKGTTGVQSSCRHSSKAAFEHTALCCCLWLIPNPAGHQSQLGAGDGALPDVQCDQQLPKPSASCREAPELHVRPTAACSCSLLAGLLPSTEPSSAPRGAPPSKGKRAAMQTSGDGILRISST